MKRLKATVATMLLMLGVAASAVPSLAAAHSGSQPAGPSIHVDEPTPTPTPLPPNAPVDCSSGC